MGKEHFDIILQFARLWGLYEAGGWSKEELELAEKLKGYDSEEMGKVLEKWAEEFYDEGHEDTVEFFEEKIQKIGG